MGKYDHLAFDSQYKQEHGVELAIANELAESNRLKRIELRWKSMEFKDNDKLEKELEDQAV